MQQDRVLVQQIQHIHRQEQFKCHTVLRHIMEAPARHIPTMLEVLDVIWDHQISAIFRRGIPVAMSTLGARSMAVLHQTQQLDIKLVLME